MTEYSEFTLAAIQASPVYFDKDASTEKACQLICKAAEKGATIAAFGETWIPGYPYFHSVRDENPALWWKAAAEYLANAIEIPSTTTDKLCEAARQAGIDVVIGIVELDENTKGTVYATLLFIGREGRILGRHRKLKPTSTERALWGEGDTLGLTVYERPYARISGLNCWEHNMVLPGYVLMTQGPQIHVAAWPGGEPANAPAAPISTWSRQLLLSRAFASQAACYVIAAAGYKSPDNVPERYRELGARYQLTGESYIIDPRGEVIAGPAKGETIITAKGSLEAVLAAKVALDVGGHYSRPDMLQVLVNKNPVQRIVSRPMPDSQQSDTTYEDGSATLSSEQQQDEKLDEKRSSQGN
ncbi:carbon-nitrogen hydrolase family protein [Chloroflexota bacterium]